MANNDITFVRPEVRAAMPVWKKIRDVCKGADAIKAEGNVYLPYLDPADKSARNKKRNEAYIERAVFYAVQVTNIRRFTIRRNRENRQKKQHHTTLLRHSLNR